MKNTFYSVIFIGIIFLSCDPYTSISIKNKSNTDVIVEAIITKSFYSGLTTTVFADENNQLNFKLVSGQEFECGFAIGELKNELPFSELMIYTKKDTIIAKNRNEVLSLFDKNWIGNLKRPYTLTVEQ